MTDILVKKKNVILDATTCNTLMSCPRYLDIRYNHLLTSVKGKSNSLEIGGMIHKVLEVYYKHKIKGFPTQTAIGQAMAAGMLFVVGCPQCAGYTAVGTPTCGHDPDEYPGMHNSPEFSEGYKTGWRFGLQTCEQYFEFYKNDALIPLEVEVVKGEVVYEDDELRVLWKAKIDLSCDTNQIGIVPMDHKSYKQRRDKSSLNIQFLGQAHLMKSRNVLVNKIGLQTSLKLEERLVREVVSFTSDRLKEWREEIVPYYAYKYVQFAESGYWPPNYTHCDNMFGGCQFKPVCEADRHMREEVLRNEYVPAPRWDPTNKEEE